MLCLTCEFVAKKSEKCDFSCFSLSRPIAKINDPQQLNLCGLVVSTCIKIGNLIHEIELFVYLYKMIKLKVQPVLQAQIYVARDFLTITTMYLIEPSFPIPFVYPTRIFVFLFVY